jgi:hypothetical protein
MIKYYKHVKHVKTEINKQGLYKNQILIKKKHEPSMNFLKGNNSVKVQV